MNKKREVRKEENGIKKLMIIKKNERKEVKR